MLNLRLKSLLGLNQDDELSSFSANGQCGFIVNDDIADLLNNIADDETEYTVEWHQLEAPAGNWFYSEMFDSGTIIEVVVVPATLAERAPTKAELAILNALNWSDDLCDPAQNLQLKTNILVFIAHRREPDASYIKELFKGLFRSSVAGAAWQPSLLAASQAWCRNEATNTSRPRTLISRHIADAYRRTEPSMKFLALYKAHEAEYLFAIFRKVEADFFLSPKEAMTVASKSLEAEVKQLISTIEERQLTADFEKIWQTIDTMRGANSFVDAVCARLGSSEAGRVPLEATWKRGAGFVYQMRCAIVHSASGVIFENFTDAQLAVEAVLPAMETSALRLLSIDI
ncbi:hypothetical protein [Bosea sp. NPDC055594]